MNGLWQTCIETFGFEQNPALIVLAALMIALIAFVGIPVPGTGAWTGTLGASFLDLGIKKTVVSVTLGVVAAAVIMASVSHVGLHVFGM